MARTSTKSHIGEGMSLSKKQRAEVLAKSGGYCWYCGNKIGERWHADHVEAIYRVDESLVSSGMGKPENDHIDNIVPACAPCNLFKNVFTVEEFRREIEQQAIRARKSSVNFRTAERFGLISVKEKPVIFWFEVNRLTS